MYPCWTPSAQGWITTDPRCSEAVDLLIQCTATTRVSKTLQVNQKLCGWSRQSRVVRSSCTQTERVCFYGALPRLPLSNAALFLNGLGHQELWFSGRQNTSICAYTKTELPLSLLFQQTCLADPTSAISFIKICRLKWKISTLIVAANNPIALLIEEDCLKDECFSVLRLRDALKMCFGVEMANRATLSSARLQRARIT